MTGWVEAATAVIGKYTVARDEGAMVVPKRRMRYFGNESLSLVVAHRGFCAAAAAAVAIECIRY